MRPRTLLLGLALGVPALLAQWSRPAPRLDADAVEYYSQLRSLYFDHDLDLADEFEHFGILSRYDKIRPTVTGYRRTIFSVGPALLWMPFYAAGDLHARATGRVEDGYSPAHVRAVALGSLVWALLGLLLLERPLRDLGGSSVARASLALTLYATFLWWYVVYEPVMSHALSFAVAALVLRVYWDGRHGLSRPRALALGALIGVAATVRWQNGVLLLLPGLSLLQDVVALARRRAWAHLRAPVATGLLALGTFAFGALPQMLAWKAVFGTYLLADPPHGRDFLRLSHPYVLQTLFSSRHGLLYWTPVLWGGFLGMAWLFRRERRTAVCLLPALVLMTYVNMCSGDWWAGGSFSNRRFDSLLPLLTLGLGVASSHALAQVRRRPALVLAALGLALGIWNWLFMQQYRRNLIARDNTVAFSQVAFNSAALVQAGVGTPLAWPANWWFARAHKLPVAQYDRMVGQYLFYRQNNLGGVLDLGDARIDPALIDPGWSSLRPCGAGALCRSVLGEARLFAPLDVPQALTLRIRARGQGELELAVNGTSLAVLPLQAELVELPVSVPAGALKRELNELRFRLLPASEAQIDRVLVERAG